MKSSGAVKKLLIALLALTLILSGCSGVGKGTEAPDFTLTDLDGNEVTLSDLRGKNVYLNFWASWCGPCIAELPDIEQVHQKYLEKDLIVLTINTGEEKETVQKVIEEGGYTFTVLLDSNNLDTARLYKTTSIPASIFINNEGKIIERKEIMTLAEMEKAIEKLYQ